MRTNITTASSAGSSGFRRYGAALAVLLMSLALGAGVASHLHHDLGPRAYGEPAPITAGPEAITTYDPIHSRSLPATTVRRQAAPITAGPEAITTYDPIHSRSLPATTGRGR